MQYWVSRMVALFDAGYLARPTRLGKAGLGVFYDLANLDTLRELRLRSTAGRFKAWALGCEKTSADYLEGAISRYTTCLAPPTEA